MKNIRKFKNKKPEKLIILFYNIIRISLFKLLHPNSAKVKNNVWIGANSTISRGTFLPDNCVVAANSVVTGKYEKDK